ncbi:MAG: hypothetical protein A2033_09105 [Bacteroidetes bacterium GWA2_31_9]|nr:MAG: hypothetical protein A2033_09105 [Bacteroidetes bacterium GWA2_31_9]
MRVLRLVLILFVIAISNKIIAQDLQNDPKTKSVRLQTSAHTDNCKAKIEKTLAYEKGIIESELNQESQILTVKYNPKKTDVKKIIKVIDGLGHEAKEIPDQENTNVLEK